MAYLKTWFSRQKREISRDFRFENRWIATYKNWSNWVYAATDVKYLRALVLSMQSILLFSSKYLDEFAIHSAASSKINDFYWLFGLLFSALIVFTELIYCFYLTVGYIRIRIISLMASKLRISDHRPNSELRSILAVKRACNCMSADKRIHNVRKIVGMHEIWMFVIVASCLHATDYFHQYMCCITEKMQRSLLDYVDLVSMHHICGARKMTRFSNESIKIAIRRASFHRVCIFFSPVCRAVWLNSNICWLLFSWLHTNKLLQHSTFQQFFVHLILWLLFCLTLVLSLKQCSTS